MAKTLIIGGGFTGLYAGYKLMKEKKDFLILSDAPTSFSKRFANQYIFLRYDIRIRQLLKELKIPYKKDIFKMGFYYNNKIYSKPSYNMVENYNEKIYKNKVVSLFNLINNYNVCTTDYVQLITELEERIQNEGNIVYDKVKNINLQNKIIITQNKQEVSFSSIINTIPLPLFLSMSNINIDEKEHFLTIPLIINKTDFEIKNGYNQVSNCNFNSNITRYIKTGMQTTEEKMAERSEKDTIVFLKYGKILGMSNIVLDIVNNFEKENIFMAGRFAQWKQHLDTEDNISRINSICNVI